jgi:hypothetical protein
MPAPRCGSSGRCVAISMPKPYEKPWPSFCGAMAALACSPLTSTHALWAAPVAAIFLPPSCAFCVSLGVEPNVCPPHRPDLNASVERFHRTLGEECLVIHLPRTQEQVWAVTETFLSHSNHERPNQARSCGNRPPDVACPDFPALPAVPEMMDPDRLPGAGEEAGLCPLREG